MKIALYNAHGVTGLIYEATWTEEHPNYVRTSEIVDVEFKPLPPEVTVPAQLKVLDAAEEELRNKFNQKLSELLVQRANLMALTHESHS